MKRDQHSSGARRDREQSPFGINYRWTGSGGVICTGHTVLMGRDRADAERRFFRRHRHVQREEAA